ncbi:hypothetical protein DIPPA_35576 [Diplonema papillatum]|nr:hypothetical protein DIPPA_35576 [Diplonema papillatum]
MASVPTKYRKHSATQLTPKTERRRWSSTGGLADQPRLEPLESGVRAEMAQAVQGGCSDSFGWALNEAKLVVFDLASGRPVLHSVIPVSQLGLNASEPVEVVFPGQINQLGYLP